MLDMLAGVDMWSVGVILLSLLSGRYPFFRAADDLSTLAEITTLLGTTTVRRAAAKIGECDSFFLVHIHLRITAVFFFPNIEL